MPTLDGSAGRNRWPQDLAAVRRKLPPVPRHADPHLAGLCVLGPVRHRRAAERRKPPTRITTRIAGPAPDRRLSSPRAFRAFQHRGDRHHRRRARRSQLARDDPRQRLEGPRGYGLPAGFGGRSGLRRFSREPRPTWRHQRLRHRQLAGLSRCAPVAPGLFQVVWRHVDRPRPPHCRNGQSLRRRSRRTVQPHPGAARKTSASGGCSERRC